MEEKKRKSEIKIQERDKREMNAGERDEGKEGGRMMGRSLWKECMGMEREREKMGEELATRGRKERKDKGKEGRKKGR